MSDGGGNSDEAGGSGAGLPRAPSHQGGGSRRGGLSLQLIYKAYSLLGDDPIMTCIKIYLIACRHCVALTDPNQWHLMLPLACTRHARPRLPV